MRPILIFGSRLPGYVAADASFIPPGWLIYKHRRGRVPRRHLKHEITHFRQCRRDGFWRFNLRGIMCFLLELQNGYDSAITSNEYERETYRAERKPLTREERKLLGQ